MIGREVFLVWIKRVLFCARLAKAYLFGQLENEIRLLPILCDEHKASIDIGANRGVYTYFLRKFSKNCVAFEPNPDLAGDLRAIFHKVCVNDVGLSDRNGMACLSVPVIGDRQQAGLASIEPSATSSALTRDYSVLVRTLDDYAFKDVGFMKVDVEGHEWAVLLGAQDTLRDAKPVLLIEIEERHRPNGIVQIRAFLGDMGYQGFFFHEGILKPIAQFRPEIHQNTDSLEENGMSVKTSMTYLNNFIFCVEGPVLGRIHEFNCK